MSVTQTVMVAKIRLRLQDRSTRRDGTAITTPRYSDTDIATAINDAIRDRQPLIVSLDKSWYLSVKDYIGITDAVAADTSSTTLPVVASEQYNLTSNFKQHVRLARRDLTNLPTVRFVGYENHDQLYATNVGLFAGLGDEAYTTETCSIITHNASGTLSNRIRIKPAPASTSYLYREFFIRTPTEPSSGSNTLDLPPDWIEVTALDAAVELAGSANEEILPTLAAMRDAALQARIDDYSGRNAGRRIIGNVRL